MGFLRYSADRRTLLIVGAWFGLEVLAWRVDAPNHWSVVLVIAAACAGAFLSGVAAHNAVHCPVFHSRALDNAWRLVLSLAYGHPVSAFVPVHNLSHHRHLETERDLMRLSKTRSEWHLLNLLFFAPRISGTLLRAEIDYARHAWDRRPRWRRQLLVEAVVVAVALAALAALDWRRLVVLVLLPHAFAAWGIVTMNVLQHDGAAPSSRHDHSRNFVGRIVNWFTFNNGFHTVHHMRPGLHWSQAPAEHQRRVAPFIDPRLVEPSLARYVVRTFVFPGRRTRLDGTPFVPAAPGRDEPWY